MAYMSHGLANAQICPLVMGQLTSAKFGDPYYFHGLANIGWSGARSLKLI